MNTRVRGQNLTYSIANHIGIGQEALEIICKREAQSATRRISAVSGHR